MQHKAAAGDAPDIPTYKSHRLRSSGPNKFSLVPVIQYQAPFPTLNSLKSFHPLRGEEDDAATLSDKDDVQHAQPHSASHTISRFTEGHSSNGSKSSASTYYYNDKSAIPHLFIPDLALLLRPPTHDRLRSGCVAIILCGLLFAPIWLLFACKPSLFHGGVFLPHLHFQGETWTDARRYVRRWRIVAGVLSVVAVLGAIAALVTLLVLSLSSSTKSLLIT